MSIVWVNGSSHSVSEAVAAVQQALEAPEEAAPAVLDDQFMGDAYLAEQVATMRAEWAINPWAVATLGSGALVRPLRLVQLAVRRLTWWYTQPQAEQASRFNAAVVRATDSLLAQLWQQERRLGQIEIGNPEIRIRALEEQLRAAREELFQLSQRSAQLEAQLNALKGGDERGVATR